MAEFWEASNKEIAKRRERVFLILAGIFLGTLAMLNILGISRFINLFTIGETTYSVAVGVLPYPVTFLCTDLISELYGKKREIPRIYNIASVPRNIPAKIKKTLSRRLAISEFLDSQYSVMV